MLPIIVAADERAPYEVAPWRNPSIRVPDHALAGVGNQLQRPLNPELVNLELVHLDLCKGPLAAAAAAAQPHGPGGAASWG